MQLCRVPLDYQLNNDEHNSRQRKELLKEIRGGKYLELTQGEVCIVPISISQSEKLNNSQSISSVFRRLLPQQ